jgi:hypothetical protein
VGSIPIARSILSDYAARSRSVHFRGGPRFCVC